MIFGSVAIKYWFDDYPNKPKDLDYIAPEGDQILTDTLLSFEEVHVVPEEIYQLIRKHNNGNAHIMSADLLYTIKLSHLSWLGKNGKWWKHLKDSVFLKNKGCKINREVYEALHSFWKTKFGDKSHISLNVAVEKFFKDGVRRKYDHDWLHEYFKIGDVPAYSRALENPDSPLMSSYLFAKLPEEQKLHCALEEMFVVSYERQIPLTTAYKNLVTTMTKGWFNLFMIVNAEKLLDGFEQEKLLYNIKRKEVKNESEAIESN